MQEVVRATTPWCVRAEVGQKQPIAPQMIESAAVRLRWVCVLSAVVSGLTVVLQRWFQPEVASQMQNPMFSLLWLFVVLMSIAIGVVQRFGLLAPVTIVNLGLVFEVVMAFAISFSETALPLEADRPILGVSTLALWIAVVGLLIPNRPGTKLVTALISASTWPLAYYLNLHIYQFEPLPANRLFAWMHMPYLMAIVSFGIAKRIFGMELAAEKARDLGSYQLVSRIGAGGMGEVWQARHRMLARHAAIKVVRAELLMGQSGHQAEITRRRFEREAQAIASLQCPHTVYLFDFGASQDGSFYYVMELLDGISLEMLVDQFGPQPAARVIYVLRQVCESLEEAHRHGLVHRDIKPSNIFVCKFGLEHDYAKVLDFGLVKDVSPQHSMTLTMDGTSAGTPAYMAPEVAMGESQIDGRVDLYSLGCVAYFLLTGSPVFDEKTATATALAHVQKAPVPPSQRSELPVPAALEAVVLRCLAKNPEDRPATAGELGRMLEACDAMPPWTQEQAFDWWQAYLPECCSHRAARRPAAVAAGE